MRLERIELKGFKSFANETVVHFSENVTAIVGPNGSGKSNIVDAFRWVLGEQKTSDLRLEKMQDVIFNGTSTRRKSGAARVGLTFTNSKNVLPTEYNQVTISRTLYRSGESEYAINGVQCRLKDIRNLFLDTGIGSNSYAIIELGMVDHILQDKDHARRRMFEQAIGISKFKSRKRETENKLRSTEADLNRVEDLLFEIENNLKDLEKQAKRTKTFKKIQEQYKESSISLGQHKLYLIQNQMRELQEQLQKERDEFSSRKTQQNVLEAELQSLKKEHVVGEKNLFSCQTELNQHLKKISQEETNIQLYKQKIDHLNQRILDHSRKAEDRHKRISEIKEELALLENNYQTTKTDIQTKQELLQQAQAVLSATEKKFEVAQNELDQLVANKNIYYQERSTCEHANCHSYPSNDYGDKPGRRVGKRIR